MDPAHAHPLSKFDTAYSSEVEHTQYYRRFKQMLKAEKETRL